MRHGQIAGGSSENLEAAAKAAARLLPGVTRLAAAQNEAGDVALLRALAPRAWATLQNFPDDILMLVRNRRLYRKYLCGAVSELLNILDLAWSRQPAIFDTKLCQTAEMQLSILHNLPPGTEQLRLTILQRLEGGLAAEVRRGGGRINPAPPDGSQGADAGRQQSQAAGALNTASGQP